MNMEAAAVIEGRLDGLDFSLLGDVDALCHKDPQFLALLPEKIKGRILKIWAEDVKDYRFYGEDPDEGEQFDTESLPEVCTKAMRRRRQKIRRVHSLDDFGKYRRYGQLLGSQGVTHHLCLKRKSSGACSCRTLFQPVNDDVGGAMGRETLARKPLIQSRSKIHSRPQSGVSRLLSSHLNQQAESRIGKVKDACGQRFETRVGGVVDEGNGVVKVTNTIPSYHAAEIAALVVPYEGSVVDGVTERSATSATGFCKEVGSREGPKSYQIERKKEDFVSNAPPGGASFSGGPSNARCLGVATFNSRLDQSNALKIRSSGNLVSSLPRLEGDGRKVNVTENEDIEYEDIVQPQDEELGLVGNTFKNILGYGNCVRSAFSKKSSSSFETELSNLPLWPIEDRIANFRISANEAASRKQIDGEGIPSCSAGASGSFSEAKSFENTQKLTLDYIDSVRRSYADESKKLSESELIELRKEIPKVKESFASFKLRESGEYSESDDRLQLPSKRKSFEDLMGTETTKNAKSLIRASISRSNGVKESRLPPDEEGLLVGITKDRAESLHRAIISDFEAGVTDDEDDESVVSSALGELDRNTSVLAMEYCYHVHESLVNQRGKKSITAASLMEIDEDLVKRKTQQLVEIGETGFETREEKPSIDETERKRCSSQFRSVMENFPKISSPPTLTDDRRELKEEMKPSLSGKIRTSLTALQEISTAGKRAAPIESKSVENLRGLVKTSLVSLNEDLENQKRKVAKLDPCQDILTACALDPAFEDDFSFDDKLAFKEDAAKEVPTGKVVAERERFSRVDPISSIPAGKEESANKSNNNNDCPRTRFVDKISLKRVKERCARRSAFASSSIIGGSDESVRYTESVSQACDSVMTAASNDAASAAAAATTRSSASLRLEKRPPKDSFIPFSKLTNKHFLWKGNIPPPNSPM